MPKSISEETPCFMASITISRLRDGSISISGLVCKSACRGCFQTNSNLHTFCLLLQCQFCLAFFVSSDRDLPFTTLAVPFFLFQIICISDFRSPYSDKIQYNSGYENWEQQSRSKCKTSFSAGCAWPLYHLIQPSRNQSSSCLISQIYIYI